MSSKVTPIKKRELLNYLNEAIIHLSNLSSDAAKLEIYDNDAASRRLKQGIVDFEKGPLIKLKDQVLITRREIKNQ
jgi:hypothetical protein